MKNKLDSLVKKYETRDFIKDDPIQFPHRFKNQHDREIAALLAAVFAYGKRELFIQKLNVLFGIMQNKPYDFLMDYPSNAVLLSGFGYRFAKDFDVKAFLEVLNKIYKEKGSLTDFFYECVKKTNSLHEAQILLARYFYDNAGCEKPAQGFCHLMSNPEKGGATKRLNMFLRWMVRGGEVDLGMWDFVKPAEIFIPLDVHVARISRQLGLLKRSSNDFKAVCELTQKLKEFDPKDPVKYDFAMFGFGVNNQVIHK